MNKTKARLPSYANDNCKEFEEIGFVKPASCSNETVPKVVVQNTDEAKQMAAISYHQVPILYSPKLRFLGFILVCLAGPIQETFYLILVDLYPRWPEVIPTEFTTTVNKASTMYSPLITYRKLPYQEMSPSSLMLIPAYIFKQKVCKHQILLSKKFKA